MVVATSEYPGTSQYQKMRAEKREIAEEPIPRRSFEAEGQEANAYPITNSQPDEIGPYAQDFWTRAAASGEQAEEMFLPQRLSASGGDLLAEIGGGYVERIRG